MLKPIVKDVVDRLPGPVSAAALRWARWLRHSAVRRHRRRTAELHAQLGWTAEVIAGPFRGMKYGHGGFYGGYLAQLVGEFERALHPVVEDICRLRPNIVVDVGAASGYYLVGLAIRLPDSKVIGYDISRESRNVCAAVCRDNGVIDRVDLRAECTHAELAAVLGSAEPSVVICDIEGGEDALMQPSRVEALRRAHVLIEVHEMYCPGVHRRLRDRFGASHHVLEIQSPIPHPDSLNTNLPLGGKDLQDALNENRTSATWLWLTPHHVSDAT